MQVTTELKSYQEIEENRDQGGELSPIESYILQEEPVDETKNKDFRKGLLSVINHIETNELLVMDRIQSMCEESLSPSQFEEWIKIKTALKGVRKRLK